MSKTLDLIAIPVGWLGVLLMFKGGDVLESAPVWTSLEMKSDLDKRNVRKKRCQRWGIAAVTLSLVLQSIAKFA